MDSQSRLPHINSGGDSTAVSMETKDLPGVPLTSLFGHGSLTSDPNRHGGMMVPQTLVSSQSTNSGSDGDCNSVEYSAPFSYGNSCSGEVPPAGAITLSSAAGLSVKPGSAHTVVVASTTVTCASNASANPPSAARSAVAAPSISVSASTSALDPSPVPRATPKHSPSPATEGTSHSRKRWYRKSSTPSADSSDSSSAPGRRSRQQQRQKLVTPDSDAQQGGDNADGETPVNSGEGLGDGSVRSSLMDEVLAEKRMALMRSPEVMQFLQQMQQQVAARRAQEREAELNKEEQ